MTRLRWAVLAITVATLAAGCAIPHPAGTSSPVPGGEIAVLPSAAPFVHVESGPVEALVPDGWHAFSLDPDVGFRGGIVASPAPHDWTAMDGSTDGFAATWVDATRVGVPSDLYYFVARGPLFSRLRASTRCHAEWQNILLDRRPSLGLDGGAGPGDYVARGGGICRVHGRDTRWGYFVAAPGFGPVHRLGIPASGLYVVVAVMRERRGSHRVVDDLIRHTSFGGVSVVDFLRVARRANLA